MNPQNLEAKTERRLTRKEVREYLRNLDLIPYKLGDKYPLIYIPPSQNPEEPNLIFYRRPITGYFVPEASTADGLYIAVPTIVTRANRIRCFTLTESPTPKDVVHELEELNLPKIEGKVSSLGVNILYMFKHDAVKLPLPDNKVSQ
jgi:hypothetical protein